jgi:hypothetical protein
VSALSIWFAPSVFTNVYLEVIMPIVERLNYFRQNIKLNHHILNIFDLAFSASITIKITRFRRSKINRCLSFFLSPLCCLFFLDLQILIIHLISLNSLKSPITIQIGDHHLIEYTYDTTIIAVTSSFSIGCMLIHKSMIKSSWKPVNV